MREYKRLSSQISFSVLILPAGIVLTLLLMFMVMGGNFLRVEGVRVELPSFPEPILTSADKHIITIDSRGRSYLDGRALDKEELIVGVRIIKAQEGTGAFLLRIDKRAPFEAVSWVG